MTSSSQRSAEKRPKRRFGALLAALFWLLLLIPFLRRLRRRPAWNAVRLGLGAVGLGGLVVAIAWGSSTSWAWAAAPAAALVLLALLLGRTADPDADRKLQRRHQAQYLLNGGRFAGGPLPSSEPLEGPLYLLIRGEHLLLVPRRGDGEVHSAIEIRKIERILVDGERYVPVYVSEAKDPPRQAAAPEPAGESELTLELGPGKALRLRYAGVFRKHLAETAAHGVYSVRQRLLRPEPVEISSRVH